MLIAYPNDKEPSQTLAQDRSQGPNPPIPSSGGRLRASKVFTLAASIRGGRILPEGYGCASREVFVATAPVEAEMTHKTR